MEKFNQLNGNVLLQKEQLMCGICEKWLLPELGHDNITCNTKNGHHYCIKCKDSFESTEGLVIGCCLKKLIANLSFKYPCLRTNCQYVGTAKELLHHLAAVKHEVLCPICKTNIISVGSLKDHLQTDHAALLERINYRYGWCSWKTLDLDDQLLKNIKVLHFERDFKNGIKPEVHTFVIIKKTEDRVTFKVGMLEDPLYINVTRNRKFKIECKGEEFNQMLVGKIHNLWQLCDESAKSVTLASTKDIKEITISITDSKIDDCCMQGDYVWKCMKC